LFDENILSHMKIIFNQRFRMKKEIDDRSFFI